MNLSRSKLKQIIKEELLKEYAGDPIGNVEVGSMVNIIGSAIAGASGKVIEFTKTSEGVDAAVIELTKAADYKLYGGVGDEVLVRPGFLELAPEVVTKEALLDSPETLGSPAPDPRSFVEKAAEYAGPELAAIEGFEDHMLHFQKQGRTPEDAADRWETLNQEEEPYDWNPRKDPLQEEKDNKQYDLGFRAASQGKPLNTVQQDVYDQDSAYKAGYDAGKKQNKGLQEMTKRTRLKQIIKEEMNVLNESWVRELLNAQYALEDKVEGVVIGTELEEPFYAFFKQLKAHIAEKSKTPNIGQPQR